MDEKTLQIIDFTGQGYKPLIDFGTWRVAYLRFIDELIPARIQRLERHVETDEVFVLLSGKAVLFLGKGDTELKEFLPQVMQPGKLYNVRQNAWHTCVLSRDATILLVENNDTGDQNTEFIELSPQQGKFLVDISGAEIEDWRK